MEPKVVDSNLIQAHAQEQTKYVARILLLQLHRGQIDPAQVMLEMVSNVLLRHYVLTKSLSTGTIRDILTLG